MYSASDSHTSGQQPVVDKDGERWPEGMKIVNGHLAQSIRTQQLVQPGNGYGYVHLAGEVERPRLRGSSATKKVLLQDLKAVGAELAKQPGIRRVDVFRAFIIPPGAKQGRELLNHGSYEVHVAKFDVVVLVECDDVARAHEVRSGPAFARVEARLDRAASFMHCITAGNPTRIAEVDKEREGVFLFNYFFMTDMEAKGSKGLDILLGVWEYTAGWWTARANLTNSTPLQPVRGQDSQYCLINHCRWDKAIDVFPSLIFKPSLKKFVLANFVANGIVSMPILYRLA